MPYGSIPSGASFLNGMMAKHWMCSSLIIIGKARAMADKYIEIEHPGIMLKEDFLDDMDMRPGTFAKAIGVDRTAVKKIIEGQRAITADMALRFSLFFDMSARFWLNLQKTMSCAWLSVKIWRSLKR